ncbi:retrovirus-related Pol polyprotein from transposon 297 [Trichonephila clavipes]|nr:retrovirus-related Pol polyprotein from transposon 297 [Trichonephila clavipes]
MLSRRGLKSKRLEKKGEGVDSGDAKKGEDEAIIVSSDAEDEIFLPALQEYDQGTSFTSTLPTEFFERFEILVRHSSVYYPQSNPVERFHRTLKRLLRVLCFDAGSEWDKYLPSILLALLTVSHESTGYTPSELVYGKNLRTPETLVMVHWMEPEEESDLVTEYMFKKNLINKTRLKDVK